MNKKTLFIAGLIFLAIIFAAFYFYFYKKPAQTDTRLDDFAKCLASKNITMYGAVWCAHCQDQKNLFGDSFKYVPYVECPDNPQKCLNEGITGYPAWVFPDGQKLVGEQTLRKLSEVSSCPLLEK